MKKSFLASGFLLLALLSGCGSATIGNVGIPGTARDAATSAIGKNTSLHYITDLSVADACAAQIKIMTDAKWTEVDPLEDKGTYSKTTYTDGTSDMVVLCSETEVSATQKATKVTLTMMAN